MRSNTYPIIKKMYMKNPGGHWARPEPHDLTPASCKRLLCSVSQLKTWLSFSWGNAKLRCVSVADHQLRSEVYYHVSHSFSSGALRQLYMPPSVILNVCLSLPPSVSPSLPGFRHRGPRRWWVSLMELKCLVPQLSPMQIALSTKSITGNSQQSVLFDALFLFLFFITVSLSVALLLLSLMFQTCHLLIFLSCLLLLAAGLPTLLHGLLQHLQYSHTVSVAASVLRQPVK